MNCFSGLFFRNWHFWHWYFVSYMSVRQSDNYLFYNLHMFCCYLVFIALC
jgi:hypothetical protein